jgi:hypothetical protein
MLLKHFAMDLCDSHAYTYMHAYSINDSFECQVSRYNPSLKGNVYEKRAASIARQLCGLDMVFDYDQLLAKPPNRGDGVFSW